MEPVVGIDIGGSGIKAGRVDPGSGEMLGDRVRLETPQPATPDSIGEAVAAVLEQTGRSSFIGVGFPAIVGPRGVVGSAMNIDPSWVGVSVSETLSERLGLGVSVVNDADAAAIAESRFGAASGIEGLVVVLTFGTGIGSGLLYNGALIRNVELGALELDGVWPAELRFSARSRKVEDLSWQEWGQRAGRVIEHVHRVLAPERIVVGGGVARKWERFATLLDPSLDVVAAKLGNAAGIVGAAVNATESQTR